MGLIAKRPCSYGGKKFFIGDEIPANLVADVAREEKLGVISITNASAGVSVQSGTLFSQDHDSNMVAIPAYRTAYVKHDFRNVQQQ